MRATSKNQLSRFRRVRELIVPETEGAIVATPVADLDGVIQRLTEHGERQEQHHREMRALTGLLNQQVRHLRSDLMVPVELAARAIYPVGDEVGASVRRAVRPPAHRADYEEVALAARGLASAVEPRVQEFVDGGLPADFIEQLRKAAATLEATVNDRSAALQRRLAATRGIAVEVRRGAALVKLIHALLKPRLRGDAPRAAEWSRAVMVLPRRVAAAAVVEPNPVLPAPEVVTRAA